MPASLPLRHLNSATAAFGFAALLLPLAAGSQEITEAYRCHVPDGCQQSGNCRDDISPLLIFFAMLEDGSESLAILTPSGAAPAGILEESPDSRAIMIIPGPDMVQITLLTLMDDLSMLVSEQFPGHSATYSGRCKIIEPGTI